MPLIDLQTNLKSLKFTGAAPYVTKDINNPPVYNSLSNELTARRDDVSRLVKMLADTPGLKFITKQALLQATDPANASDNSTVIGQIAQSAASVLKNTARTVGTVLAQAGVNGTGTHFINPSPEYYYTAGAAAQVAAVSTIVTPKVSRTEFISTLQQRASGFDTNTNRKVGKTDASTLVSGSGYIFLKKTPFENKHRRAESSVSASLDSKYGFAKYRNDDKLADNEDLVGVTDIYSSPEVENLKKDMVPIVFGKYPESDYKLFRGFIGNISDNFQANWNGNKYVGRMENFFVYTGFNRTVSFALTVPVFTRKEQPVVYNKVNALVSHTAPEYTDNTGIPSGIITHLRIGDYLDTPGVLTSVGVTINNDVPWSPGPGKTPMTLPQVLQLSIQFTPIHTSTPQYHNSALTSTASKLPYIGNTEEIRNNE